MPRLIYALLLIATPMLISSMHDPAAMGFVGQATPLHACAPASDLMTASRAQLQALVSDQSPFFAGFRDSLRLPAMDTARVQVI
jgi:hypothetical protein